KPSPAPGSAPPGKVVKEADGPGDGYFASLRDPAFDKYVNLEKVGEALAEQDSGTLCDLVLKMAEGERVVGRPHRALGADKVFHACVRLAVGNKDRATLDRLAQAAKDGGDQALAAQIELALTASRAPARPAAVVSVNVEETPAEVVIQLQALLAEIRTAQAA